MGWRRTHTASCFRSGLPVVISKPRSYGTEHGGVQCKLRLVGSELGEEAHKVGDVCDDPYLLDVLEPRRSRAARDRRSDKPVVRSEDTAYGFAFVSHKTMKQKFKQAQLKVSSSRYHGFIRSENRLCELNPGTCIE